MKEYKNQRQIISPSKQVEPYQPSNMEIESIRKLAYMDRSDGLFMAYQKYKELGNQEQAQYYRDKWIQEINNINEEYPYGTN